MGFKLIGVPRAVGAHSLGLGGWMILLVATIVATPFVVWLAARGAMLLGLWG
jgi:hypothetical protein